MNSEAHERALKEEIRIRDEVQRCGERGEDLDAMRNAYIANLARARDEFARLK